MKKSIKTRVSKDHTSSYESGFGQQSTINHLDTNFTINNLLCSKTDESSNSPADMLTKLQNRLLQGRNNDEKCDFPPYKKVHLESESQKNDHAMDIQQLQQMDKVIAQNKKILCAGGNVSNLILPTKNQNNSTPTQNINNVELNEQTAGSSSVLNQKLIKLMPTTNQSQTQNFKSIPNNFNAGAIGGYLIGSPSNPSTNMMNQGQQVILNPGNNTQIEFVRNPYQHHQIVAQQQSYQMNCSQGDNKIMVIMPMATQNRPVQYITPTQINSSAVQQQQHHQPQPIFIQSPKFVNLNHQPQQAYPQSQPVIYLISPNQSVANTQNITFAQNNFGQQQQQQPYIGQGISFTNNVQYTEQIGSSHGNQGMNLENVSSTRPIEANHFLKYTAQNTFNTSPAEKKEIPQTNNYQTKKVVFEGNPNPHTTINLLSDFRAQLSK